MSELKSDLYSLAASMSKSRHLKRLQVISEHQKTVSGRKLGILLEEIEDCQRLDAIFLKKVIDHINRLENRLDKQA